MSWNCALPPACQARRINGRPVLEILLPADVLPVGILQPMRHYVRITQILLVFQIVQRHHQPCGGPGRPCVG